MSKVWYFLDPDNTKSNPVKGLFCLRCKRPIKRTQSTESFLPIILHPTMPWFRIAAPFEKSDGLIGDICFRKAKEEIMEQP